MKRGEPFNVLRNPNSWSNAPRAEAIAFQFLAATGITATQTAIAVATTVASIGLSLVTSWAVSALTPKPETPTRGLLVNARESAGPQDFVYGEIRKGGVVTYYESTDGNDVLHQIIVLAGHEVEDIVEVYLNDEVATLSGDAYSFNGRTGAGWVLDSKWGDDEDGPEMQILYHKGGQTSINDTFANSSTYTINNTLGSVTSNSLGNFVGNGIAYLYVRYVYNASVYANGLPLVTAKVRGKKVYDPRTTSTVYSNNAALCIRDYLTSAYGLNDSEIDDTVFSAAANVCDESVSLAGGGTEDRYAINGVVQSDQSHGQVLQSMMTACAGTLFWGAGKWKLIAGEYNAPTKTFTLDDLRSSISLQTRVNLQDQFNIVQGVFNDAAQRYIPTDYPPLVGSSFITEDGGIESPLDFDLPFTTSAATAQRLAKLTLFRGREQMTFEAEFGLNAFDVEVGEIVALTIERYGWTAKEFEVVGWRFGIGDGGDLRVTLSLRETSSGAFSWTAEESEIISNNTTLLPYTFVPSLSIPSDQIVSTTRIVREKITEVISLNLVSSNNAFIDYVEVQYKETSTSTWISLGSGTVGTYELVDPEPGVYEFRARIVNGFGYKGAWVQTAGIQTASSATAPSDVSNLFYEVNGGNLTLEWDALADLDLSYYRIRHAIETSGASWANATTAIDKVPRPGTSVTLPTRSGTYLIRAYDKTGILSENSTSVVVSGNEVPSYTTTLTQTDSSTFSGTKTGCSVNGSSQLVITTPTTAPSEATYDFSTYIETSDSTARVVRARIDAAVRRLDNSAGLFDDLPGNFDDLAGLFDDLTGASVQLADTNLLFYISTTEDDPAGSPTWSDYKQFRAGEFYGRAFRFRVVLKSTADNITPAISTLSAIVEYN